MHYLSIFFKKVTNHAIIFRTFGRKTQFIGNFEKFFEIFQRISEGNCKISIILAYFSKNELTYGFIFRRLDEKHKLLGRFEKLLEMFDKNSIGKLNF